jgi:hypothetical protein
MRIQSTRCETQRSASRLFHEVLAKVRFTCDGALLKPPDGSVDEQTGAVSSQISSEIVSVGVLRLLHRTKGFLGHYTDFQPVDPLLQSTFWTLSFGIPGSGESECGK